MAKNYIRGADYKLYLDTASNFTTPTWVEIKAVGNVSCATNPDDVEIPERGMDTGHLKGENNPAFKFTLYEDQGDAHVETLIANGLAGTITHLAVSRGPIATSGTKYLHMECLMLGIDLSADRPDPSSYDVNAYRHANSDNNLARATTT